MNYFDENGNKITVGDYNRRYGDLAAKLSPGPGMHYVFAAANWNLNTTKIIYTGEEIDDQRLGEILARNIEWDFFGIHGARPENRRDKRVKKLLARMQNNNNNR